jgi:hypothetical protein
VLLELVCFLEIMMMLAALTRHKGDNGHFGSSWQVSKELMCHGCWTQVFKTLEFSDLGQFSDTAVKVLIRVYFRLE